MNVNQRYALLAAAPEGHGASEIGGSPVHRVVECTCGWRAQFSRRGRNGLATTSLIHAAIREHYERAAETVPA